MVKWNKERRFNKRIYSFGWVLNAKTLTEARKKRRLLKSRCEPNLLVKLVSRENEADSLRDVKANWLKNSCVKNNNLIAAKGKYAVYYATPQFDYSDDFLRS